MNLGEQIDYSDYRDVAGVKVPHTVRHATWNQVWTAEVHGREDQRARIRRRVREAGAEVVERPAALGRARRGGEVRRDGARNSWIRIGLAM